MSSSSPSSSSPPSLSSPPAIVLLGSGLVSGPFIHYAAHQGYRQYILTRTVSKALSIVKTLPDKFHQSIEVLEWDVEKGSVSLERLDTLLSQSETNGIKVVVSLLPYIHHVAIAKVAIHRGIHFASTSYVSAEMKSLHDDAFRKGIILLNECGVDPGLDHMSAMRVIDGVRKEGGRVISFTSLCGGLPSPSSNNNPFGYKLSWSPRGVLLASTNTASFLHRGEVKRVEGATLYEPEVGYRVDDIHEGGFSQLEYYPNRDSTPYKDIYNIPDATTILRGTYRNVGWCRTMKFLSQFKFTDKTVDDSLRGIPLNVFAAKVLRIQGDLPNGGATKASVATAMGLPQEDEIIRKLEWIGLVDASLTVPSTLSPSSNLDVMCYLFERRLQFENGETDAIVMKHTFVVEYDGPHDGITRRQKLECQLIDEGHQSKGGFSSMARTVALPVAIACDHLIRGGILERGVVIPTSPSLYNIILNEMEREGVKFSEKKSMTTLIIRAETKKGECRVPLTPLDVSTLIKQTGGALQLYVERSVDRCFPIEDYAALGCKVVPSGWWQSSDESSIVLGLKELPDEISTLSHRHIYFAHCYKQQSGWKKLLKKFHVGGGSLDDLEFLTDANGRRVAAFGRAAGMVGMALGVIKFGEESKESTPVRPFTSVEEMISVCKSRLSALPSSQKSPSVIILGAKGRCGQGAKWVCDQIGIKPTEWDIEETKGGGPFVELLSYHIVVNCIYLTGPLPPFITRESLISAGRQRALSMVVDVSCDTTNLNSPLPFYREETTFDRPVLTVPLGEGSPSINVIAIDHLPSLIPSEASSEFSASLLPHVVNLVNILSTSHRGSTASDGSDVWKRSAKLFKEMREKASL